MTKGEKKTHSPFELDLALYILYMAPKKSVLDGQVKASEVIMGLIQLLPVIQILVCKKLNAHV